MGPLPSLNLTFLLLLVYPLSILLFCEGMKKRRRAAHISTVYFARLGGGHLIFPLKASLRTPKGKVNCPDSFYLFGDKALETPDRNQYSFQHVIIMDKNSHIYI